MKHDLVTFGEAMIRLSPRNFRRVEQANQFEVNVGGSELNAAVVAQRLGLDTSYVTRLTRNPLGRMIANKAQEHGVDTSHIVWTESDRVGIYYVEFGASPRSSTVLYDRRNSALAAIHPDEVDWDKVFLETRMFLTSGITPSLSHTAAEATKEAIRKAKRAGVKVSIDLNYRTNLWSEEEARVVMTEFVDTADILITTAQDAKRVFRVKKDSHEEVAKALAEEFHLEAVALTFREVTSVWKNTWGATVYCKGEIYRTPAFDIEIVDRLGAGDSFSGGFLFGYLQEGPAAGVCYGVAVSALKQTSPGDLCWATRQEVEHLLAAGSLRIDR